jgi:hypothetical protein
MRRQNAPAAATAHTAARGMGVRTFVRFHSRYRYPSMCRPFFRLCRRNDASIGSSACAISSDAVRPRRPVGARRGFSGSSCKALVGQGALRRATSGIRRVVRDRAGNSVGKSRTREVDRRIRRSDCAGNRAGSKESHERHLLDLPRHFFRGAFAVDGGTCSSDGRAKRRAREPLSTSE